MGNLFDDADFYDNADTELLRYEDPDEYALQTWEDSGEPIEEARVEVVAYKRQHATPREIQRWADLVTDTIAEMHDDEYGGPDDSDFESALEPLARAIAAATQRVIREHVIPWRCHEVARRTYFADDIRKLMEIK